MNFDRPSAFQENPGAAIGRDVFLKALDHELVEMVGAGRLSPQAADEKRRAAALIETGFSNDPHQDALLFSRAGVAEESEMVGILNNTVESKSLDPDSEVLHEQPREIFVGALDRVLTELVRQGGITQERAEDKRKAAALIETGFSDDPENDALIFSRAGVADEQEMINLFNKKST